MHDLVSLAKDVNEIQSQIENHLTEAVRGAIQIGDVLSDVKNNLPHGQFMSWVTENCVFAHSTAVRYIKIAQYQDELQNRHALTNLQEAYQQIETIERQKNQTEKQKARQRVDHYMKTGEKLDGWRRGTDDAIAEKERKWRADQEQREQEWKQQDEDRKARREQRASFSEELNDLIFASTEIIKERQTFKERIRLSQAGQSDNFIDALMDYLEELPDDNRRIESCQNIIKVCKNIAVQLQRGEQ